MDSLVGRRLPAELASVLEGDIRDRKYEAGEKLPTEAELAQHFAVSRSAVREAIAQLRSSGMVHTRQGAGTYVASPLAWRANGGFSREKYDEESLRDVFEIRRELETGAAALAARCRTVEGLDAIRAALAGLERAVQAGRPAAEHDVRFHQAIAQATGNALFVELLGYFHDPMVRSIVVARSNTARRGDRDNSVHKEHCAILEAIEDGDPDAARAAMLLHINNALKRLNIKLRGGSG